MGTNYYLHQKQDCECCGRPFEPIHIGKSSGGWCFSLHVIPDDNIRSLDDWRNLWTQPGAFIRNEYGEKISIVDMELTIAARHSSKDWDDEWWSGYGSEQNFHVRNQSERGPNGLLRHRLGNRCIAHGEGTWDCVTGEYS